MRTEVRADGLFLGCLLAIALSDLRLRNWAKKWSHYAFYVAVPVFLFDALHFHTLLPGHESLAIAIIIGTTSLHPEMLLSRALEWEYLRTTGLLSYSIYVWQGFILFPGIREFWPVVFSGSFLLSYAFIEQPARRLGRRLAARLRTAETVSAAL